MDVNGATWMRMNQGLSSIFDHPSIYPSMVAWLDWVGSKRVRCQRVTEPLSQEVQNWAVDLL